MDSLDNEKRKNQPEKRLPPSHYYKNPNLQEKRLSDTKEMILYMVARCLTASEAETIADLVRDPQWVQDRALTSSIAQDKDILGVGFFHSRRPELEQMPTKLNLPFRLFQYPNPNERNELYFLVFTGHGEPPNQEGIRRLLTPPKADNADSEGGFGNDIG